MSTTKPKEPLVAIMLTFLLTGLGQIYAGQVKKGIAFLLINVVAVIVMLNYLMNPVTKLHSYMMSVIPLAILFGLYIVIDAYLSAKKYNQAKNFTRNISVGKRILLIVGILLFYMFNVNSILANYIRFNVIQAFRVSDDSMGPILARILVNKASYKKLMPQRGDIVVFEYPGPDKKTSIKRLIALPGDKVETRVDGKYVNGNKIDYPEFTGVDYYNQKIPEGAEFVKSFDVADGFYYLQDKKMGAAMPLQQFLGKVFKIYYPFEKSGAILKEFKEFPTKRIPRHIP